MTTVNYFTPIEERIQEVESRMRSQSDGHHPELASALNHLLSSGGKRVRPAVALLTGGMLGADPDHLVTLGAAIELLHTATLVHDDLIDGALLRRGIVTLNAQWTPGATVLTGDFIFARAAKLAAETNSVAVMRLFAETLSMIVNGEITQMFTSRGLVSREDYHRRIHAKTASMFELAAAAAATLSGTEEENITQLRKFGYDIGMAFQIVDDILDYTGDQSTVGKPVASDLRQGLITLPTLYYLENNPHDLVLQGIIDGKSYQEGDIDRLVEAIRESGAIEMAMEDARGFIDDALEKLQGQPECPERLALERLTEYIIRRPL